MKIAFHTITALLLLSHSELRIFIGDESLGWSAMGPQTGVEISTTVEGSIEI